MTDRFPDGIKDDHVRARWWHSHANPFAVLLLGSIVLLAFSGALGGQPNPAHSVTAPSVRLSFAAPAIARSGMFFEMRVAVDASRRVDNLVLAVSPTYWRELTVNTMIPAADESFGAGGYRFAFGPMAPGGRLQVKVDGQINPALVGGTAGTIRLFDGETELASLPVAMKVRP